MPEEINKDNFEKEVIYSEKPVLVDFWGPQCVPCMSLMAAIENLEKKYKDKLRVVKVNAPNNKRLCLNLKVIGLPTFLIFNQGKEVARLNNSSIKISDIENELKNIL